MRMSRSRTSVFCPKNKCKMTDSHVNYIRPTQKMEYSIKRQIENDLSLWRACVYRMRRPNRPFDDTFRLENVTTTTTTLKCLFFFMRLTTWYSLSLPLALLVAAECFDFIYVLNIELIFCPQGDSAVINLISAINSSTTDSNRCFYGRYNHSSMCLMFVWFYPM